MVDVDAPDWLSHVARNDLTTAVAAAVGDPHCEVTSWRIESVDYRFGSPTTGGMWRLRGEASSRGRTRSWSIFVKLVRSYRLWPLYPTLPQEIRNSPRIDVAWRYEADVYGWAALSAALPTGVRLPEVHLVQQLSADEVALWLEDVPVAEARWDLPTFESAAELLGLLGARLTTADALPPSASRVPGEVVRLHYDTRLSVAVLPVLCSAELWRHPLVAEAADGRLRVDMLELAGRLPALLDALDELPQVFGHGDASPQNLLVPAGDSRAFVAIDWSLGGLAAVGYDLGQLLVGLAHAGELPTSDLGGIRQAIVRAHTAGLAAGGIAVSEGEVRLGLDAGLVVRSAFAALPLERLREPVTAELTALFADRVRLTRYLVDLGLALKGKP